MGGNAATCSGGPRCVKYGVTKNYILGLEVVLPTGELLKTGVQTLKGVAGYDLTSLFVGSEGTLGIITRINVRLIPLPQARQCMLATFPRLDDAPLTVSAIIKSHIIPSTLEFIDQTAIRFMDDYLRIGLPFTEAEALLLIEVDGDQELISKQCTSIEKICYGQGASAVQIARSPEEEAQIWRQRRSLSPNLLKLNPDKINEDITVPISKIPDIIRRVGAIAEKYRLISVCFGHAGDGNIHVNLMINRKNPDDVANAHKAVKEIFRATLELGGTISGEHGIGITKAPFLEMDIGSENFALMNRLKHLLDPHHILNPGKLALS
jgi:glycolate oxidase